jgi:murein DD-endopeptidase MepM/ murein hydrolase activator NlpD
VRLAGSVSTVVAALLLTSCAAGSSAPPPEHNGADSRIDPAQPATATPSAASAAITDRPIHYTFPVHHCSASPSGSHHDYPASDVFTQRGCEFVAVTRGRVDEVSFHDRWDPSVDSGATRGGLSVSIVGDDGVRYYGSHLKRIARGIKPGVRVHTGQLLGRVGNTGDAVYTPTHVHFGISWPTRAGKWWVRRGEVWPQRFFTAWRDGDDLSPRRAVRRAHERLGNVPHCTVLC